MAPVILMALLLSLGSSALAAKKILVYRGEGVCQGCAEDIAAQLKKNGDKVHFATGQEVTPEHLRNFDLYIQPGGDDVGVVKKALGRAGQEAIKNYVAQGGHYFGICLGAFMADSTLEDDNTNNLYLIAARTRPHSKTSEAHIEKLVSSDPSTNRLDSSGVYFQDGPEIIPLSHPIPPQGPPQVLALYQTNHVPAALINRYGKGSAMAIGFHPEATEEWYIEDKLCPRSNCPSRLKQSIARNQKYFWT